jgi:hypothetical protein
LGSGIIFGLPGFSLLLTGQGLGAGSNMKVKVGGMRLNTPAAIRLLTDGHYFIINAIIYMNIYVCARTWQLKLSTKTILHILFILYIYIHTNTKYFIILI